MMKEIYLTMQNCTLFENMNYQEFENTMNLIDFNVKNYTTNEMIAIEETPCNHISIILEGAVSVQSIFPSGKVFTIANFNKSQMFGEAIIFADKNTYPASITATKKTKILSISKENIIKLFNINNNFSENFLTILSNKIVMLNKKTKILALDSIRKKMCFYIINKYKRTKKNKIRFGGSKKSLSEQFGISRPSLSRELIKMKEDGLIDYDRKYITIIDLNKIENELLT